MRVAMFTRILALTLSFGLAWSLTPVVLGDPDVCCPWPDFPDYGDGRDGVLVISTDMQLWEDKYYQNLTIQPGVTLDTQGYTVRVCETLLNRGIITDTDSGGDGGEGGDHGPDDTLGKGHDPREDYDCNHQPLCTNGQDGGDGNAPSIPQPGQNGHGGCGGGGGGGGGGAWWTLRPWDADGGDGGIGGDGGKGGGYVKIYAFRFDNPSPGVVHADGLPGSPGWGLPSDGCQCSQGSTEICGPEHCVDTTWPQSDASGGGGGGGGGGAGGNGGTVEIHYDLLIHEGTIHANGGAGAAGGTGDDGCCNQYERPLSGGELDGCSGGAPNGGSGGAGEHASGCSEDGTNGGSGAAGAPGSRPLTPWRRYCKMASQCYWEGELNPYNDCEECNPDVSMTDWTCRADGRPCEDGLWCNGANDTCQNCECDNVDPDDDPCPPCGCDEDLDVCVDYTIGGQVYLDCDYPSETGLGGVDVCVSCVDDFEACTVTLPDGMWEIPDVPCHPGFGNTCTVTANPPCGECCYVEDQCPPPWCDDSVEITIDEAHKVENQNLTFWNRCIQYDMNCDGDKTIPGDVPCFRDCCYYDVCACCMYCCDVAGDCNCDGFLSIVGDVACFVDCLYWGDCPECPPGRADGRAHGDRGFTIGGAIFTDLDDPIFSGLAGVAVTVQQVGGPFTDTVYTQDPYGIWQMADVPEGTTHTVTPSLECNSFTQVLAGAELGDPPPITIQVNQANEEENQNIKFLARLTGDLNCDGSLNGLDIDPFVQCLITGQPYPGCTCDLADGNYDGSINGLDVDPFVQCLTGG